MHGQDLGQLNHSFEMDAEAHLRVLTKKLLV